MSKMESDSCFHNLTFIYTICLHVPFCVFFHAYHLIVYFNAFILKMTTVLSTIVPPTGAHSPSRPEELQHPG